MAWLLGKEQEQVCDLCGEDADDGPLLFCTNSIWAGKWPGCFGATHEICLHPPPKGANTWTCGPCARLSEYAASQQFPNGDVDFDDIDVDGANVSQDELEAQEEGERQAQAQNMKHRVATNTPSKREDKIQEAQKQRKQLKRTASQDIPPPKDQNGADIPTLRRSSSCGANDQRTQRPSASKRDAASEHSVQRPPRDPTLNKRLKSTFTNVGPPRQRVAKIPKGRDVPVDLLPVNKISKGTTMLKAGGARYRKPAAGSSAVDCHGKVDLGFKRLRKDVEEPSLKTQQVLGVIPRDASSAAGASHPSLSRGHKVASEALAATCAIKLSSDEEIVEDTAGARHQPELNTVPSLDDVDLPCAESKLSHAKVDKGSCCMSKKEVFNICTFLTDSLGESVAQGVINQPKEVWKVSPHQDHIWTGLLRFPKQPTSLGGESIGPVEMWSSPTIFPNFGCDVKSLQKIFQAAAWLNVELLKVSNLLWLSEEYYRGIDTHAQLILYADSRAVRLELTKLNRHMAANCLIGCYTPPNHAEIELYLAPGSASSQLAGLVRYRWTKSQLSKLGIVKSATSRKSSKRVTFWSKNTCSKSGPLLKQESQGVRKFMDRDSASDKMVDAQHLTPIDTSHTVGAIDQRGGAEEVGIFVGEDSSRLAMEDVPVEQCALGEFMSTDLANGNRRLNTCHPSATQPEKDNLAPAPPNAPSASRINSVEEVCQSLPPGFGLNPTTALGQGSELEHSTESPQSLATEKGGAVDRPSTVPISQPPQVPDLPLPPDKSTSSWGPREPLRYPRSVAEINFSLIGYEECDDTVSLIEQLISHGATYIRDPQPTTVNLVSLCKDRFDKEGIIGYLPTRDYVDFEIVFVFGLDDLWSLALSAVPKGLTIQEESLCFRAGVLVVADHLSLRTCTVAQLQDLIEGLKEGLRKYPRYLWKLKVSEHSWADLKAEVSNPQLKDVLSLLWGERWDPLNPFASSEEKAVEFMQPHDQSASVVKDIPQVVRDAVKMAWRSRSSCRHVILLIGNEDHLVARKAKAAERVRVSGENQTTIQVMTVTDAVQKIRWIVRDSRVF